MSEDLSGRVKRASKWSAITELGAKLIAPISTVVLARLLTPEAFGILVTATMIISFAEIFTDAGFQKYIVQHEFDTPDDLRKAANVAFWTNLSFSLLIWIILIVCSGPLAKLVGSPGYGTVIAVSSICIPLAAFSSLQMALFRRRLDFKTLFFVRIIGVSIPLIITIPIAFFTRSYWSLIIGMIALNVSNAILLTIKSSWKPYKYFNGKVLHEMLSFSIWSLVEAITIWFTSYIDIFFVGKLLDEYYLGLYRTSINTVAQIIGLITAATTPVLFSTLSRLQTNMMEFNSMFLKFQKIVGVLVIPLGIGIYVFRNLITEILLGPQWHEAAFFIGIWGLTSAITVVLAHYSSEVYRALGKPKVSVIVQLSQIGCIIPAVLLSIPYGFDVLCEWRALVRMELVIVNLLIMWLMVKLSPWKMIVNILPFIISGITTGVIISILPNQNNYWIATAYLVLALIIYLIFVMLFPRERSLLINFKSLLK